MPSSSNAPFNLLLLFEERFYAANISNYLCVSRNTIIHIQRNISLLVTSLKFQALNATYS